MNVLYIASDKDDDESMCPGSIVCLSIAEKLPDNMISIQNTDILRKTKEMPPWLNGTPIFINENEAFPYKGKDAIRKLQQVYNSIQDAKQTKTPAISAQVSHSSNQISNVEDTQSTNGGLDDHFKMDVNLQNVDANASSGKITEQDLQKYMEQRNNSAAGQMQKQSAANAT